jgi:hypothetical protein
LQRASIETQWILHSRQVQCLEACFGLVEYIVRRFAGPGIYTYTWKNQTDAGTIIDNYIKKQREGLGPFHFYHVDRLTKAFEQVDPDTSGLHAFELEASINRDRLSPEQAAEAFRRGEKIGHTVALLRSQPA